MASQCLSQGEIDEIFIRSAALVKSCGKIRLRSRKTFEETLTVGGVDFWAVISPMLAVGAVADALGQRTGRPLMSASSLLKRKCRETLFRAALPVISNTKACVRIPASGSVLFLGFSRYMFRETLESVAKSILQKKEFSPALLTDLRRGVGAGCNASDLFENSIWAHWTPQAAARAKKLQSELAAALSAQAKEDFFAGAFGGEAAALKKVLSNNFKWAFEVLLPRMTLYLAAAEHMLAEHKPGLIVSPDVNDPRTRIFTLLARNMKIPTLEVQLSFYLKKDVEWRFFVADHLAVIGEANKEMMEFHGVRPERMTITGSARYDKLSGPPLADKDKLLRELGVPAGKTLIMFASQPYVYGASSHSPEARIGMIRDLFELAGGDNRCHLLVKPHPIENSPELKELAAGYPNITFADKTRDIRELIGLCDAFVTFCSNATFDALVRKKPTVVLSSVCSFFEDSGAALVAQSREDLRSHFDAVISGIAGETKEKLEACRARFIEQWLYKADGQAAARIEALALRLARGGN